MRKIILSFLFVIASNLWCQILPVSLPVSYNPDTSWKSIETEHFKIIYDKLIEEDAQDIANKLETAYKPLTKTMGDEIHHFTIVLTARNTVTNGFVNPINNHSEFFPIPPLSSHGTTEWYTSLVLHEGRHMAQFSNIRDSLLQKVTGVLMGSNNAAFGALIPLYFFEGDAVLAETLLTESGRGREPSFERGLRTLLLSDKKYSFQKALYRSRNDYYPNHYVLGYYLMAYMRREYGEDVISRIIDSAANDPFPLNFSRHCYFVTGKTIVTIYNDVMAELKSEWEIQDTKVEKTVTETLIPSDSKIYTNRLYPQVNHENELVYLQSDLDGNSYLYKKGKSVEKHIRMYGSFSLNKERVVFSDSGNDIRWDSKGYSDIFVYDLEKREKSKLTDKRRLFYPSFSNDGRRIAAVEYSLERIPSLVILNSISGEVEKTIPFNRGDGISSPAWNNEDNKVVISRITEDGNCLGIVDLKTGDFRRITEYNNISKYSPVFYNNFVIFTSTYSGIENLHSLNIETGEEFQVVSSKFGADFPSVNNNRVFFSQYNLNGYGVDSYNLDEASWIPVGDIERNHVDYFEPLIKQEETPDFETTDKVYDTHKYNPNLHLIDIHAWLYSPFYSFIRKSDVNKQSETFDVHELILISNDRLGIMENSFYTHFNTRNKSFDFGTIGKYRGFFPELSWDINLFFKEAGGSLSSINLIGGFEIPLKFAYSNQSLGVGISAGTFIDFAEEERSKEDLSYFISYSYNVPNLYFNSRPAFKHYLDSENAPQLKLDNKLSFIGPLRRSIVSLYNSNIWSLGSGYGFNEIDFLNNSGSLIYFNEPSTSYNRVRNSHFFSGSYYIPLGYPELSILNWIFIDSISVAPGYEGVLSTEKPLNHVGKISAKIDYRLLRLPLLSFYSQFTAFYDINDGNFNYYYIPIYFSFRL